MCAAASLELQQASRLFKALGDETRLRIVALLSHGELCVCHLESALGLTQFLSSQLYEVSAVDTMTFTTVAGILLVTSMVGSYVPARRATRVDPMLALRSE